MKKNLELQKLIATYFLLALSIIVFGQEPLSNNGGLISIKNGAFLSVHGDVINSNNGVFHNTDTIYLFKNWINNAGNEAFASVGKGIVILKNADQRIQGTDITRFYDLRLEGTGIKHGDLDVYVDGFLHLNDREFSLNTNTVHIFTPFINAVTQQGGFVSSLQSGGLLRHMTSTLPYSFPVGSSLGTTRFRPIDLKLNSQGLNVFKVRMANVDATNEGYDRADRDSSICEINPDFYHRIYHVQGGDSVKVKIHYEPTTDGIWDSITHWQNDPKWEITGDVIGGNNPNYNQTFLETSNYIDDFTHPAFALASVADSLLLQIDSNPVCEGETFTFTADPGFLNYDFYVNDILQQSGVDNMFISVLNHGNQVQAVVQSTDCVYYSRVVTTEIYMNSISLAASMTEACPYETIIFTASTGFNNYNFLVNGVSVQNGVMNTYTISGLNNGDMLMVIGTDDYCDYESNIIPITIYENQVDLTVDAFILCEGENFNFTATPGFLNYDFLINGVSAQNGPLNTYSSPLNQFDEVQVVATDANCDYESNTIQVTIYMNVLELTVDTLIVCAGDSFTFTATSGYNQYDFLINGGIVQTSTSNIFTSTNMQDGDVVTVHATDDDCTYISNPITVNLYQNTISLSVNTLESCEGDSLVFTATPGFLNYDFYVNFTATQSGYGNTFSTNTLSDGDIIFVIGTDQNCEYQSNQIQIIVYSNSVLLETSSNFLCEDQPVSFIATPGFLNYEYYVNGTLLQNGTQNEYTANSLMNGDSVFVVATDANCTYISNSIEINFTGQTIQMISSSTEICEGGSIIFTASSGFDHYEFLVNEVASQTGTSNIFIEGNWMDGDSVLVVGTIDSCQFTSNVFGVTVFPGISVNAFSDTTIYAGTSVELTATGADFYNWTSEESLSCEDCPNPIATPDSTTLYIVYGESMDGCTDTSSVYVIVLPIDNGNGEVIIPNAFTPNGDGKNDTWHISYLDAFPENEVVVLNRWGDQLYYGKPYIDEFDGTYQGKPLPRGTYYFILNVSVNGERQTFKGPLTIVR